MSRRQIAQELECNFNMSGETVIHPDDIVWLEEKIIEPKYRTGFDRNFWIWENYQPECTYLLTADVARGDGQDSSTFHILKLIDNLEFDDTDSKEKETLEIPSFLRNQSN